METRLQSNEVRIPKKIDNINLSNNSGMMVLGVGDEIKYDDDNNKMFKCENNKKIEFSTIQQCNNSNNSSSSYFQSSYARSLSSYGQQQSQSLDFELNYHIDGGDHQNDCDDNLINNIDYDKNGLVAESILSTASSSPVPPPLPATAPPSLLRQFSENNDLTIIVNSTKLLPPTQTSAVQTGAHPVSGLPVVTTHANLITPTITTSKRRNTINNINIFQQDNNTKLVSTDCEVLRLRKECQSLIEDNRRLISVTGRNSFGGSDNGSNGGLRNGNYQNQRHYQLHRIGGNNGDGIIDHHVSLTNGITTSNSNVETVVLQTQINTLQWQLKQVESSRQMYHAVMEEVVRFLERCHNSLNEIEASQQQISRSKSVSHVYHQDASLLSTGHEDLITSGGNNGGGGGGKSRQRTSTKIMEKQHLDSSTNSFGNFKDFTWRRSPKYADQLLKDHLKTEPHKLAQEAFRLFRTAQNLLNLKEPTLAEVQSTKEPIYQSMVSSTSVNNQNSSQQQHQHNHQQQSQQQQQQQQQPQYHQSHLHLRCSTPTFPSVMMINRNINSRESRLSIQSSTDDSVHSTASSTTSSSRPETDEDITINGVGITNIHKPSFNQKISNHHQHQQHLQQHNSLLTPPSSTSSSPTAKTRTIKSTSSTNKIIINNHNNLIDDESGFSSMNSFQEIGIPISLTLSSASSSSSTSSKISLIKPVKPLLPHRNVISQTNNQNNINSTGNSNEDDDDDDEDDDDDDDIDAGLIVNDLHDSEELLKNPSIKLRPFLSAAVRTLPVCHRRWSSAPPIPPKRNLSAFNADGGGAGEPLKVLWV